MQTCFKGFQPLPSRLLSLYVNSVCSKNLDMAWTIYLKKKKKDINFHLCLKVTTNGEFTLNKDIL